MAQPAEQIVACHVDVVLDQQDSQRVARGAGAARSRIRRRRAPAVGRQLDREDGAAAAAFAVAADSTTVQLDDLTRNR
jgi:hypothetical protein